MSFIPNTSLTIYTLTYNLKKRNKFFRIYP
nr:MAG TPA: hypothetical protein [Caudoviricetes sp.]